ncbi:hypothetical protein NAT51_02620 [Flavobacterium amniphilum]|uniref:hypothetical protein n=1 Tax=Flavobacterium amniphilum TaxID=1834035 RepID=UPI00202A74B2|nr:hypothetical protein [Flavobacterium amniphilum]MCL9804400.1 hypothetical protein [Flavobacterium amniphilum]
METFKNIAVGFGISFIGSVPLGYLNLVGFHIYTHSGLMNLLCYLSGVICIEVLVIYATLKFINLLDLNPKWKSGVNLFSVFFLFGLAFYFYYKGLIGTNRGVPEILPGYPSIVTGLFLSCLNFAQIPFWTTWNLFLVNGNYISNREKYAGFYLIGTVLGAFAGMLTFILGINCIVANGFIGAKNISASLPLLLIVLTVFQIYQFFSQNRKISNN